MPIAIQRPRGTGYDSDYLVSSMGPLEAGGFSLLPRQDPTSQVTHAPTTPLTRICVMLSEVLLRLNPIGEVGALRIGLMSGPDIPISWPIFSFASSF
jgi:hypothetical protein